MKNRNAKDDKKVKRVFAAKSYYDMYERKEKPLEEMKRIAGPRYDSNTPLYQQLANLACDNTRKAKQLLTAVAAVGFTFKFYKNGFFQTVRV